MHIPLKELFLYRQYTDGPVFYYFDRKKYTIISLESIESSQDLPYERYIPIFQVDEKALQNSYIQRFMGKSAWHKYQNASLCFEEFLQRNGAWNSWWDYYKESVCDIARQWCKKHGVSFVE